MTEKPLLVTHGCSLSNAVLFVADALGLFAEAGLNVCVPEYRAVDGAATRWRSGDALVGTMSFLEPIRLADIPDPPVIICGSGANGIALIAKSTIEGVRDLDGKVVGTFAGDPLHMLLRSVCGRSGIVVREVYLPTLEEAMECFASGRIDAVTLVEPFVSRLCSEGAVQLSDGSELWGATFPDTVFAVARSLITDQPELAKACITALLAAEEVLRVDTFKALSAAGKHFPQFQAQELEVALTKAPPLVDLRPFGKWLRVRWDEGRKLCGVEGQVDYGSVLSWHALDEQLRR